MIEIVKFGRWSIWERGRRENGETEAGLLYTMSTGLREIAQGITRPCSGMLGSKGPPAREQPARVQHYLLPSEKGKVKLQPKTSDRRFGLTGKLQRFAGL